MTKHHLENISPSFLTTMRHSWDYADRSASKMATETNSNSVQEEILREEYTGFFNIDMKKKKKKSMRDIYLLTRIEWKSPETRAKIRQFKGKPECKTKLRVKI